MRFETPPGRQAQVDFAHFRTVFTDEPGAERDGLAVLARARPQPHAVGPLRRCIRTCRPCCAAMPRAFEALGGVPEQILYDRMRTVFSREDPEAGHIVYNRTLLEFARHYGYLPKACQPYRAKTKGKVERPFRYIREDFFLGRSFRNLDDLNRPSSANGSTRSPTCASTPRPGASSPSISPRSGPGCSRCRPGRSRPCCASSGASPATAWSRSTAISTACPNSARRRVVEVHSTADEVRILEEGRVIAVHPVLDGAASAASSPAIAARRRRPTANTPRQRRARRARSGEVVALRPLAFYDAVGRRLAANGAAA